MSRRAILGLAALWWLVSAHAALGAKASLVPPPPDDSAATAGALPAPSTPAAWAAPQIEAVVAAGVMGPSVSGFRAVAPLTWSELQAAFAALGATAPAVADTGKQVSVRELDAQLVRLLKLSPAASTVRRALVAAGLAPPARVGTETVARLVGLRFNHPQQDDVLELLPDAPVNRAEAAFSFARVLELRGQNLAWVRQTVATLALPALSDWQRRVLDRAVAFVGYPYVWGGTSEAAQAPFGTLVPGGFDCSGFVWRVYKTEPWDGDALLATVLRGRTTYTMSAEVKPEQRIPLDQLQVGDVLFWGDEGIRSSPSQVGHMGIFLAPGWFVHSSRYGTTIAPLSGWYLDEFAWARRPLAEAGLG